MGKYYALEKSGDDADLYIFGNITSYPWQEKDKDAYGIVKELRDTEAKNINVHINSYGGAVAEGLAIYNTLKNHGAHVTTICDGFACSAASVIFMAGDKRIMNEASLLMIHNAWTYASGNADDLRKEAEDLDKITEASVNAYMSRVSISEEDLKKKMDDETWITAEEAVADGFATGIMEDDGEGAKQSAMKSIRERLIEGIAPAQLSKETLEVDADEIAEAVAKRVETMLLYGAEGKNKETGTGWGAFFNSEKGEK